MTKLISIDNFALIGWVDIRLWQMGCISSLKKRGPKKGTDHG